MIRYRQEHCCMVLMLLLIRYLFLSTRSLTPALCRLLGSRPKSAPSSKKDAPHDKSNYRPVSILVTLGKVFETCLLAHQLSDYFSSVLSPFLSAYRLGYSCEAVLLRLIENWRNALENKCVVGEVSMDLSKALNKQ